MARAFVISSAGVNLDACGLWVTVLCRMQAANSRAPMLCSRRRASTMAESEPLPPSVLILDQSDADSPWYADFSAAFRSTLNAGSERRFSVYSEHLDLSRFPGTQHHEVLRTYLQNKYRDRPIGVLVAQGSASLAFLMRSRAQLWPGTPVVFDSVDKATADRLNLPPDVTGTIIPADLPRCRKRSSSI